eukprot:GHRQ01009130.1.p1 GENE.GHRQ01009130.1~~GHRQ01009130.1.p1  ORF type:complete len:168 (-),score=24.59 GHRQ01009130.1:1117-1620(-)
MAWQSAAVRATLTMGAPVVPQQRKKQQREQRQAVQIRRRELDAGTKVVNLLGTASVGKPKGCKGCSWIKYWALHSGHAPCTCCAEGCYRTDNISGSHVKIAGSPAAALLHTRWYIVPACPKHNKYSSCKTFQVKRVLAIEAPPSAADRMSSWKADVAKLARALVGKR